MYVVEDDDRSFRDCVLDLDIVDRRGRVACPRCKHPTAIRDLTGPTTFGVGHRYCEVRDVVCNICGAELAKKPYTRF